MKVLIISHNPFSTKYSIGKTMLSLFAAFNKNEICQLFIHTGFPNKDVCSSYYRITDEDVLEGLIKRHVYGNIVRVQEEDNHIREKIYNKIYRSKKNKKAYRELLRDFMWDLSPWYNHEIKDWIHSQKPTCIFIAIGSSIFLYKMALQISRDYHLPIFPYVCDDFYSMQIPKTIFGKLWKKKLVKMSKKLFHSSEKIISICDEIKEIYQYEFGRPVVTVMTGSNFSIGNKIAISNSINTIRYFGKLSLNRYSSLVDICYTLDAINEEEKSDYSVEIFCGDIDYKIKTKFDGIKCVKFYDFVYGDEFYSSFFSSDILLHVEAFDNDSRDRVRHSISTKIADSLASGIPLFAYGPSDVSSIKHLIRNNCAMVAVSKDELKEKLKLILTDTDFRQKLSEHEIKIAKTYHDSIKNSHLIRKILS